MSEIKEAKSTRKLSIIISGAGIAGLTAAHFLLRAGHKVTIIEHAQSIRPSGQNVDVRGHALTILKWMKNSNFDAEGAVREKVTTEKGLRFVDVHDAVWAEFPVGDGASFTGEIEIMRGDLANVLYDSVKNLPGLKMVFGTRINGIEGSANDVQVSMDDGSGKEVDLVVAADGIESVTRMIAFGDAAKDAVKPLGQWSCWFSIPYCESDSDWARWYNGTKGRMILIRPDRQNGGLTRLSLWMMARDPEVEKRLTSLVKAGAAEQKQYWGKLFGDADWEASRVVQGLEAADDFYMQRIAQVKIDAWSKGRVVLVGDAACCPSPISGMGVTNAMVGAYVLAGEVSRSPEDLSVAVKAYEDKMRPFVIIAQQLAPGTPGAANPESLWGIRALHCFLGFMSWTGLYKLLGSSVNPPSQAMQLPDY